MAGSRFVTGQLVRGLRRRLTVAIGRARHGRRMPGDSLPPHRSLEDIPVAVLDTETTGLNPLRDRVVAVAGLRGDGGCLDTSLPLDLLVHPGIRIPPSSTKFHGIRDADVAAAPSFGLIWPSLRGFWRQRVLVGHNIGFDLALLRQEAERARIPFHPPGAALDIGLLYAGLKPRLNTYTLESMAEEYGVVILHRHNALADATAEGAIWCALLRAMQGQGIGTLGQARALMGKRPDLLSNQHSAGWATDLLVPHG